MLLVIDVGNTNTVFGVDDGHGQWPAQWRVSTARTSLGNDWAPTMVALAGRDGVDLRAIRAVCICSVVPAATVALSEFSRDWLGIEPLVVAAGMSLNIKLGMDRPDEVGADRIANAVAAWESRKAACIVVDFGTATKVEAITADGIFAGGSIAAGVGVSLDALTARAARLFGIELVASPSAIGKNTAQALQAGLVNGHLHLVNGLVGDIQAEIGKDAPVLVTGGHAAQTGSPFSKIGDYDPDLTLNGIRHIHRLNSLHR